jgi:hypothetical protein
MCQLTLSTYLVMPTRRVTGYPRRGPRAVRPDAPSGRDLLRGQAAGGAVADRRRDYADAKTGVIESTLAKAARAALAS